MIHVLYVDDEEPLLDVCRMFLERSSEMLVETAISAEKGLAMISKNQYDAIISDYQMPEMNGIGFLKEIRSKGYDVPFILFTGRGREEVVIEALNNGADFYLQKGGDPKSQFKELEYKIRESVRRHNAEEALRLNEARLAKAQTMGSTGCWEFVLGPDGGHYWGSPELDRIFGLDRRTDGIMSKDSIEKIIIDVEKVREGRRNLIEKGIGYDVEYEIAPADGGPHRYLHSVGELERDAEGRPVRILGIAQDITERKKNEVRLQRMNRELVAIKECNRALVKADSERELLEAVCRIVCDVAGYRMAWIGMAENDRQRSVRPIAWGGYNNGYVEKVNATWGEDERGRGPTGQAIRTGRSVFVQDFSRDQRMDPWRAMAILNGYRSCISLPLLDKGKSFGALMVYSGDVNGFTYEEVALLEEMAGDLAFGIVNLRTKNRQQQAEMALNASEQEFRNLFENNPNPVILVNFDGVIIKTNQAGADMVLKSKEEIIGGTISDLGVFSNDDLANLQRALLAKSKGEPISPVFSQVRRRDGTVKWVQIRSSAVLKTPQNNIFQIIIQDITECKEAEETIRNAQSQLKNAMDLAKLVRWEYDVSKDLFTFDDQFYTLYGSNEEKEGGRLMSSGTYAERFVPENEREVVFKEISKALSTKEPDHFGEVTHTMVRSDGERRIIHVRYVVVKDKTGKTVGLYGANQDITETKRVEDALRASESKLNHAEEVAGLGHWQIDLGKKMICGSPGAEIVLGLDKKEFDFDEWKMIPLPEYRSVLDQTLVNLIKNGRPYDIEFKIARPRDGEIITIHSVAEYDKEKNMVFGILQDVTGRVRIENDLRVSEEFYRELMSNLSMGVVIIDPKTRTIENLNDAAMMILGSTKDDIIGKKCYQYLCPGLDGGPCPACDKINDVKYLERSLERADGKRLLILKTREKDEHSRTRENDRMFFRHDRVRASPDRSARDQQEVEPTFQHNPA